MSRMSDQLEMADVQLVNVSKSFGSVGAVHDVSFEIRKGEFFSLLGPSGCGKSTTLRMIGGFEDPTAGQVFLCGKPINGVPAHRRATNMVFQQMALFPHLSVFENVAFGLRLKRVPHADIVRRVRNALVLVSLEGFEGRYPSQLSGGQQQRVAIARALVNEPAVLLLDEPLGALDLKLRVQMQAELKALQARLGTTFIYVTHDQGEALAMSNRLAVMNAGRVEQIGTPQEIYERPRTRFVATFVGETNLLTGTAREWDGASTSIEVGKLRIRVAGQACAAGGQVLLSIRPEHVRLSDLSSPPALGHGVCATVRGAMYQGAMIRYTLDMDGNGILLADVVNGADAGARQPGDRIRAAWDPERVAVLPP